MAEQNLEAKLKNLLKQEKIQLWNPPYTEQDQQPGQQHMQVGDPPEEAWPHTPEEITFSQVYKGYFVTLFKKLIIHMNPIK